MPEARHTPQAPTRVQSLASGESIDAHRHDEHQILYAGSGVLAVTTDAGTWFAPGTRAIWVPAGTVHAHRAHGRLDLHMLGVPATDNPLGLDAPTVLVVSPLLRELIRAYTRPPREDSPERRRLRAVLLDELRASPQRPVHLPDPTDPRLVAVCSALRRDPADDRTLAALGADAGVSERTLTRLFRAELGMTFPQWRTQLRLYHALRMLADGTAVTTVARHCGWSSTSAFIDVFRRAYGHTPGTHHRLSDSFTTAGGGAASVSAMTIEAKLDAIGIVASDLATSLAFYRALGLAVPEGAEDQPHVEVPLGGGMRLMFDTEETVRSFLPDWKAVPGAGRIGLAVALPDAAAVDATYARLTAAGHHGEREPFDAPWGQRYALLHDPDGNGVDLYAPLAG